MYIYIHIFMDVPYFIRKDCCGVYRMDENRRNKPYNTVCTTVLQYICHISLLCFAGRLLAGTMFQNKASVLKQMVRILGGHFL